MKRVLCTIPNCPESVMGVKYTKTPEGMLSDPLPNEEADRLCTINGYEPYINVEDAKALAAEALQKAEDAKREADDAAKVAADLQAEADAKAAEDKAAAELKAQEESKASGKEGKKGKGEK